MGLNLAVKLIACVVRILHDDWSIRLGENGHDQSSQPIKHLAAMQIGITSEL